MYKEAFVKSLGKGNIHISTWEPQGKPVGVFQIIRNLRYRKDAEYREKIDTEASDERNSFLRMKSWSWTGYIVVLVEGVGSVVAMATGNETVQLVLLYSVCLMLVSYWVTYMVLARKY
jgi:hypothetical protein